MPELTSIPELVLGKREKPYNISMRALDLYSYEACYKLYTVRSVCGMEGTGPRNASPYFWGGQMGHLA